MSYFASLRRPLGIAAALTASIAIVACNPTPAPKVVTVTSVTVAPVAATLAVKATVQATATVQGANNPAQAVTWSTSDISVATVSSTGLITAVKQGSATVSANATVAGYTSKSGSVKITVTAPINTTPTVSKVAVSLDKSSVPVGGTAKASAVVTGTFNPAQTVIWTSSAPAVATVDANSGDIKAISAGKATITGTSTVDGTKNGTAVLTVTPAGMLTSAKINFEPTTATTPPFYTRDSGAAYTPASMTGWVTEASAGTANPVPLNLTNNARLRTVDGTNVVNGLEATLYTQIQMQCGTPTSGNPCNAPATLAPGAFEYKVVNGKYNVTVSVGDADKRNLNSSHTINVEGVPAISAFVATASNQFKKATVNVTVTDGKLTIDAKGGKNTKLNYVEITPAP